MPDLEFHKKLICNMAEEGLSRELLESYIESCWDDAMRSPVLSRNNTAPENELRRFSAFIVEGYDMEDLIYSAEAISFSNLSVLTDEEYEILKAEYGWGQ